MSLSCGYRCRLERAFANACTLPLTKQSRYILISDCHRGAGTNNDNFLKNRHLYYAALQYYYQHNYYYLELGDGEELWENRCHKQIIDCHQNVYALFEQYKQSKRICRLYGNHDYCLANQLPEAVFLKNKDESIVLALTHGHQADFLNSTAWRLSRFLVRYLWKPLEGLGVNDPTSAAKNYNRARKTEQRLSSWAKENNIILICGHTHRPRLPQNIYQTSKEHGIYLNTGSCVHPYSITGIEIIGFHIYLVKWEITTDASLALFVKRSLLADMLLLS